MAHISLNQYLQQVESAWNDKDGVALAEWLSFDHAHSQNPRLQLKEPEDAVERVLDLVGMEDVVSAHLRCLWAVNEQDFMDAYRCQSVVVAVFTKGFSSMKDENWALPVVAAMSLDLRRFAARADCQAGRKGKTGDTLQKAAEGLMGLFRVCAADNRSSEEETKRWGMLGLVNQLFKIYFRINKLHLCKPLVRAIESSPLKDQFSLGQQVTYKYYVGRKAMFDSDYKESDEYLTFAFEHCHHQCKKNKRLILTYLIPVKMLRGYFPSPMLLQKYDLLQFRDVVSAVKEGNVALLNDALLEHEAFFIKCGIYLILEKLRPISYRNLFKAVHTILETHQIPVEAFMAALETAKVPDVTMNETACILANLIYEGKIKGYISHQHKKLVVSKQIPFPSLTQPNNN